MALILDVARFKYPPHWVPVPLLWEAMNTIDEATGLHRGYIVPHSYTVIYLYFHYTLSACAYLEQRLIHAF